MAFELIVQAPFNERLKGGAMREHRAGDHIVCPDAIGNISNDAHMARHVVRVWVPDAVPMPQDKTAMPESLPAAAAAEA